MENQVAGNAVKNLLIKRGWKSEDNKVFTKDGMTMQKQAGNKFSKWYLHDENGKELLVEGELNYAIGVAQGLAMAAGSYSEAPVKARKPRESKAKEEAQAKPAAEAKEPEAKQEAEPAEEVTPEPEAKPVAAPKEDTKPKRLDEVEAEPGWSMEEE